MKKEETLKRAFRNLQKGLRLAAKKGIGVSGASVINFMTLGWVLDLMPPEADEVSTARLMGDDYRKDYSVHIDSEKVLEDLIAIEFPAS